jgi:hypothetical protein
MRPLRALTIALHFVLRRSDVRPLSYMGLGEDGSNVRIVHNFWTHLERVHHAPGGSTHHAPGGSTHYVSIQTTTCLFKPPRVFSNHHVSIRPTTHREAQQSLSAFSDRGDQSLSGPLPHSRHALRDQQARCRPAMASETTACLLRHGAISCRKFLLAKAMEYQKHLLLVTVVLL